MNMNFQQIAMLQKFKSNMTRFRSNHPKFSTFVDVVSKNAMTTGTVIEVSVTTPEGKNYSSNIRLTEDDIELIQMMQQLDKQ